jgi:NAD(P)-dependent dehydrogenase (short-subunit alcohol dehydrogenase family)
MGTELAGKVAIVTGGASGIGRATVELFVAEGAQVVIADIDSPGGEALAADLGPGAAFKLTDVSDPDQVQDVVDFAVQRFGGLHVMFNNAGISSAMTRFLRDDLTDFTKVINVNLLGVMLGSQRAARHMAANGGGSIINNSSIAGIMPGDALVTYRVSKAAVIHFTKSAAIDFAQYGIRVNCIAPAHIATAITHYEMGPVIRFTQPLQRVGQPEDVANTVLYLASERSAQVTGVLIPVDGGTSAGPPGNQMKAIMAAGAAADERG